VVLGLCAFTHDSSAALLIDGALVGFVEEERLSGIKHTRDFPRRAIDAVLSAAAIELRDVRAVAYNFVPYRYLFGVLGTACFLLDSATRARALPRAASFVKVAGRTAQRVRGLAEEFPGARVRPVLHHGAHGLYAFAASGFERSAVLVVDSLGETQTTAIGYAEQRADRPSYRILRVLHDPASLGYAYGAVTEHLGFRRGDEEGTVMALAGLGDPARFRGLFARMIHVTPDGFTLDPRLLPLRTLAHGCARTSVGFARATCPPRPPGAAIEQVHRDVAAALQERTEQVMLHLAGLAQRTTAARRLCVGGGVATNCLSMGKIVDAGIFDDVFVPPAPGDAGTAVGAAAAIHLRGSTTPLSGIAGACYLGPAYPRLELDIRPRPGLSARRVDDPAPFLADRLAQGRIVGLFQGKVEAGPRALGNRSILASPLLPDVVERLNATVKFRESFRPFAPVVLADRAAEYFTLGREAPFMSMASGVTELARVQIPAVVHVNGTARIQTVTSQQNPFLASVLEAFAARTGVPVLINTSLNVKGMPICGTPEMALDCLASCGLDALLIEGWWVTK
jgi:carbamoyltransferase